MKTRSSSIPYKDAGTQTSSCNTTRTTTTTSTCSESSNHSENKNKDDDAAAVQEIRKIMTETLGKALKNMSNDNDTSTDEDDDDDENKKPRKICKSINPNMNSYTKNEMHYFKNASDEEKNRINNMEVLLSNHLQKNVPIRFKIFNSKLPTNIKSIALRKHDLLNDMDEYSSEYFKQMTWIENLLDIPFQHYSTLDVDHNSPSKIYDFLIESKQLLDSSVYGHVDAKLHILRLLAQKIVNPDSKGLILGISGKPGVGKTMLVKNGVCKALKYPFSFIPLGGSNDGSFLEGHSITYEGSTWGKIVDCLMKSKCMNPVLFFDELDKVSDTSKGQEIINILIHLTDPTQNDKFTDKYFSDIELDLSKCIIIFTYNDEQSINPILLDRITKINVGEFSIDDKIKICSDFLIPEILTQFQLQNKIHFNEDVIKFIIHKTDTEAGVRNLKRSLEFIISNINISRFIQGHDISPLPNIISHNVSIEIVETILKSQQKSNQRSDSLHHMYL